MKFIAIIMAVVGGIVGLTLLAMWDVDRQMTDRDRKGREHLKKNGYVLGQKVRVRVDGRPGVIVGWHDRGVRVRVGGPVERTRTHLISPDGTIERSPLSIVHLAYYEIEPWEKPAPQGVTDGDR